MSNVDRDTPYIYQPFGMQDKDNWKVGRIYGVAGLHLLTTIKGLTKPEAESVLLALTALAKADGKPTQSPAPNQPASPREP